MQDLLLTKLFIPPAHVDAIARSHLFEHLDTGLTRKLTLISAPAGFGKTTLVVEWLHQNGIPAAWLSLDEGDNDFTRFLTYMIAAIQTLKHDIGEDALALLHTPQASPVETVMSLLINDLTGIVRPSILVLDDYHVIQTQSLHTALSFLLDHMPPQMHIYLTTRADPPLPLARLRGRMQLVELRAADLRFNREETVAFLRRTMRLNLTDEAIAQLEARTEGWVTGLQMAALPLRGGVDVVAFIDAFGGNHQYIADYLTDEVLGQQSEGIKDFLLKTAILERMTGPLCDAVCEMPQGEGQRILQSLAMANLFLVPLDDERRWYRYHRLFADLLQQRLRQTQTDLIPILHHRASVWLDQHGMMREAIEHAFAADDDEWAANLVAQAAEPALMRGENITFLRWAERLPESMIHAHPALYVYRTWALMQEGSSLETVEQHLTQVEQGAEALRAFVAIYRGQTDEAFDLAQRALDRLPRDAPFLRSIASWSLGVAHCLSGDMAAGQQIFEQMALGSHSNVMMRAMTLVNLGELSTRQGLLHQAQALYQQALEFADGLPIACHALAGLGELWREWNDLDAAERYIMEGLERAAGWGEIGALDGYLTLAHLRQSQGDATGAEEALQRAQRIAVPFDATQIDDFLIAYQQVRLWIAQGNLDAARRWLEENTVQASYRHIKSYYKEHLRARLLLAQGQYREVQAVVDKILPDTERHSTLIELHLLNALALQAQNNLAGALQELECALALGEPGGYVRVFLDEGEPLMRLLYRAAQHGTVYAGRLLAMSPLTDSTPEMVEPLSEREIEVLRLVAEGLTNREIAVRLVVSANTIKKHTINIFSKLSVRNRTQAVEKARQFGIL